MSTTIAEIAELVGGTVVGDDTLVIAGANGIREAETGEVTFLATPRYSGYLTTTKASAVLAPPSLSNTDCAAALILVEDPYNAFAKVVAHFKPGALEHPRGIHPAAVIAEDAQIGADTAIDALARIESGCVIGERAVIYGGVYVGRDCVIGDDVVLYPNVVLREETRVGNRCIIHAGAIIGSDGFGYSSNHTGHAKIPQVGAVVLGDDVEIGANSAVDRATFGKTVIGTGTKIDNLVQIGHNVQIGEHCIIAGTTGIAGSSVLGNFVTVAAGAGIAGHIEIGDGAIIAGFAGVTKSVPAGQTVSGFPAIEHQKERRIKASVRQTPDMLRRIRELEARIQELESQRNGTAEDDR